MKPMAPISNETNVVCNPGSGVSLRSKNESEKRSEEVTEWSGVSGQRGNESAKRRIGESER